MYGEKFQTRGKVLIFSSSSNLENGRGRGKDNSRSRGRGGLRISEDQDDGASYSRKNYRAKVYDKMNESADSSEDGRIGRQLRLLSRETDEDVIIKICQQLQVFRHSSIIFFLLLLKILFELQEAFLLQDNLRYIRYNLIGIGNSLLDTYKLVSSQQGRQSISMAISRLGFVSDHDFNRFAL